MNTNTKRKIIRKYAKTSVKKITKRKTDREATMKEAKKYLLDTLKSKQCIIFAKNLETKEAFLHSVHVGPVEMAAAIITSVEKIKQSSVTEKDREMVEALKKMIIVGLMTL